MKNISTYLSLLSLALVGVLFYLYFSQPVRHLDRPQQQATDKSHFKIAYFDIDSLQNNYQYFKDVSGQIKKKESDITAQLSSLQDSYQKRIKELQAKSQDDDAKRRGSRTARVYADAAEIPATPDVDGTRP